jgi:hypothetical protein
MSSTRLSAAFIARLRQCAGGRYPFISSIVAGALLDALGTAPADDALLAIRDQVRASSSSEPGSEPGSASVAVPNWVLAHVKDAARPGETVSDAVRRLLVEWFDVPPQDVLPPGPRPRERQRRIARKSLEYLLKGTFISVRNARADVCRVRPDGSEQTASNMDDLRLAAELAVEAQGYSTSVSGIYHCPPELAARAVWNSSDD